MTKESTVFFLRWTIQEEDGIVNKAVIPVFLLGLAEDAQRNIIRTLTTLPHELQCLLSVLVSVHTPSQNC